MRNLFVVSAFLVLLIAGFCLIPNSDAAAKTPAVTTLVKGMNIGNWLDEDDSYYIQSTRYTKSDFADIKSLGCDHIRIEINFETSDSPQPDFPLSPIIAGCMDKALNWAEQLGLKVILSNHYNDLSNTTYTVEQTWLVKIWQQVAERYASKGDVVLYEIIAEPGDKISAANWNTVAAAIIAAIRSVDTNHTIIVGPVNWFNLDNLNDLETFSDANLIYAFNFFRPLLFTHQGASWHDVDYNTVGIPFPYNAARMPALDPDAVGTPIEDEYNLYTNTSLGAECPGTVEYLQAQIDKVAQFAETRNVPVLCSTFGADMSDVEVQDRANWLGAVASYLESKTIPWCLTGYRGNWGIFDDDSPEKLQYNVNDTVATALGLTPPEKQEYEADPLLEGFTIYNDEVHEGIRVGWWLGEVGEPDFFVTDNPHSGEYCMGMLFPGQWNAIDFYFPLYLDMQYLIDDNSSLDLWIRCDDPIGHIQLRFEDTDEDSAEHPWRMNVQVDDTIVPFDGEWQHFEIPLNEMEDQGSWDPDDEGWYDPEGLFDWTHVQRFQLVSEIAPQTETELYFDDIRIIDPYDTGIKSPLEKPDHVELAQNYPNPFNPTTTIEFTLDKKSDVSLNIYNIQGELVRNLFSGKSLTGSHRVEWDGTNNLNNNVASGIYVYTLETNDRKISNRMVLLR